MPVDSLQFMVQKCLRTWFAECVYKRISCCFGLCSPVMSLAPSGQNHIGSTQERIIKLTNLLQYCPPPETNPQKQPNHETIFQTFRKDSKSMKEKQSFRRTEGGLSIDTSSLSHIILSQESLLLLLLLTFWFSLRPVKASICPLVPMSLHETHSKRK